MQTILKNYIPLDLKLVKDCDSVTEKKKVCKYTRILFFIGKMSYAKTNVNFQSALI